MRKRAKILLYLVGSVSICVKLKSSMKLEIHVRSNEVGNPPGLLYLKTLCCSLAYSQFKLTVSAQT